ncbi:ferritin-like domain-containing protein [Candidatus Bipolaricaulota bacterium]|nr:ferritin-like domain-containing protein [Candidatus Bipolaricaulota bacterium]
MAQYHEPVEDLDQDDRDIVRALMSLKEEVEAVNWYQQRASATDDAELEEVLAHNRDEEIEHAVMAVEWLRRNMPAWEEELNTYLFTEEPIAQIEELEETEEESDEEEESGDLGIGNLQ